VLGVAVLVAEERMAQFGVAPNNVAEAGTTRPASIPLRRAAAVLGVVEVVELSLRPIGVGVLSVSPIQL
jgi:hypothetical protein